MSRSCSYHLSQHEDPSSGCGQQAPPLSSGFSLGLQQTDALFLGAQQDEEASACFFSLVTLLFLSIGICVCVSMVL